MTLTPRNTSRTTPSQPRPLLATNPNTPTTPQLSLQKTQWEVFQSTARFRIVVAGRRFGKTELALAEILRAALQPSPRPKQIWYVGPTDSQTRRIFWDRLKALTQPYWAKLPCETDHRITLTSGASIFIYGTFKPKRLRGNGIDFLVLDEFASIDPTAWNKVFRPALADRKGHALFIGTPLGRNHMYDQFHHAACPSHPEWQAFLYATAQGGLVDAEELASVLEDMGAEAFNQEFAASFSPQNQYCAYYAFTPESNVTHVTFRENFPLIWAIDFNVNPMTMLLMQHDTRDNNVYVLEEIIIKPNANTELACEVFLKRALTYYAAASYLYKPLEIHLYGDASGNQRRTTGAHTDWTLIKDFFKKWVGTFKPFYFTTTANPLIRDRVACVNARLRNAAGESHLFIDPSCRELIRDCEEVSWAADATGAATNQLDKSDLARTHATDALGYFISQKFNLRPQAGHQDKPIYFG